jgi:hypothetical protein
MSVRPRIGKLMAVFLPQPYFQYFFNCSIPPPCPSEYVGKNKVAVRDGICTLLANDFHAWTCWRHNCARQRKFGHINVVCLHSIACIGRKRGKRGWVLGGRNCKMGQLTLGKRPARIGICNHIRRASIPSKGSFLAETIHDIACNVKTCNMCVQYEKKIFLLCRLKINHASEGWNMCLFLPQQTVRCEQ